MLLYLVRHAHAVSDEENPARPLSSRGREDARRLAEFFQANHFFVPHQIWHSPLLRARETAEIFRRTLNLESGLVETPGLMPEDEVEEIAARLASFMSTQPLALVGHEPHLSALATLLVRGKPHPAAFEMKKGAILALERTDEVHRKTGEPRWVAIWHVVPGMIRPASIEVSGEPANRPRSN